MPIVVIAQSIISAISIPTEADNINIHMNDGELVSLTKRELKQKHSTPTDIVYKRNKEYHNIAVADIDYIRYESLDTYDKTANFIDEYNIMIKELDQHVLDYYNTKRYRKSRTSQTLAVAGWTLAVAGNPIFWAVAPIPTTQAALTMKQVDKAYVLNGSEWKACKKFQKEKIKALKEKAQQNKEVKESPFEIYRLSSPTPYQEHFNKNLEI
ncbi:hypothetical protein [Flammeovirga pacifica]|uniref:Uncharacterized protein n=1 Tax=Flammeovirga pacifica TaxID=915059 RepID=A0A1S1Z1P3_FLAPC|nr:hypothetical protein [Flammeovirga pacifica]OHX67161.1 hypothetical protein NH26_12845 [Flammeovirga pacifica]